MCNKLQRAHPVVRPRLQLALTAPSIRGGDAAAALQQARRNRKDLDMMLGRQPLRHHNRPSCLKRWQRWHRQQLTRGKVEVQLLRQFQLVKIIRRLRHLGALLQTLQTRQVPPRLQHLQRMIH